MKKLNWPEARSSCPPGSSCTPGSVTPKTCSQGTYSADWGSPKCEDCVAGTFNDATGQDEATDCEACVAGQYSVGGTHTCLQCNGTCPAGQGYAVCPAGSDEATDSCTPCAAGEFSPDSTDYRCIPCMTSCGAGEGFSQCPGTGGTDTACPREAHRGKA